MVGMVQGAWSWHRGWHALYPVPGGASAGSTTGICSNCLCCHGQTRFPVTKLWSNMFLLWHLFCLLKERLQVPLQNVGSHWDNGSVFRLGGPQEANALTPFCDFCDFRELPVLNAHDFKPLYASCRTSTVSPLWDEIIYSTLLTLKAKQRKLSEPVN